LTALARRLLSDLVSAFCKKLARSAARGSSTVFLNCNKNVGSTNVVMILLRDIPSSFRAPDFLGVSRQVSPSHCHCLTSLFPAGFARRLPSVGEATRHQRTRLLTMARLEI
jgi:hypothetical protein